MTAHGPAVIAEVTTHGDGSGAEDGVEGGVEGEDGAGDALLSVLACWASPVVSAEGSSVACSDRHAAVANVAKTATKRPVPIFKKEFMFLVSRLSGLVKAP